MSKKTEESIMWYKNSRVLYVSLAKKVELIIQEVLEAEKIVYYTVTSRAKEIESFSEKAFKDKYKDPQNEIMDMAGIRVITYFDSDVEKVCKILEDLFMIFPEHSVNKTDLLGADKVGYRSVHYVATLPENRTQLREFKPYKGLLFEVQVRTILQHAWAEIEHDRNYKFSGILPIHLKRRFALVAGVLELADKEFDSIASDIDSYADNVSEATTKGKLDILIDTTSLREYMSNKFSDEIKVGLEPFFGPKDNGAKDIFLELSSFGINTLAELDAIIPDDLHEKIPTELSSGNFIGLLRTIMIISNAEKYFSQAWNNHWSGLDKETEDAMIAYNIPIEKYEKLLNSTNYQKR